MFKILSIIESPELVEERGKFDIQSEEMYSGLKREDLDWDSPIAQAKTYEECSDMWFKIALESPCVIVEPSGDEYTDYRGGLNSFADGWLGM